MTRRLGATALSALLAAAVATAQESPKVAGKDVPAPRRTRSLAPVYPPEAIAQGLRGIVILDLLIDTQGHVAAVDVVRSVPPFDEAAIAAARKWEYEVTRVDGRPVSVRLTVPITFALKLPELTRQEGIPELRQGAAPRLPAGAALRGTASATASVTLEADGRVAEARLLSGDPPFSEALLAALRTWRFAPGEEGTVISFRVRADFVPDKKGSPSAELRLTGLQRSEAAVAAPPQAPPAPTAPESPAALPLAPPPAAPVSPAPAPPASPASAPTAPAPQAPAASPSPPEAPTPPAPAAAPRAAPRPPATEVVPAPPAALAPPVPPTPGVSAVEHVSLAPGVPDLVRGRRPVVPPFARMAQASGEVSVRFSVDSAGRTSVQAVDGPDLLRSGAEQAVGTWIFRRVSPERLYLVATFSYQGGAATAGVEPQR